MSSRSPDSLSGLHPMHSRSATTLPSTQPYYPYRRWDTRPVYSTVTPPGRLQSTLVATSASPPGPPVSSFYTPTQRISSNGPSYPLSRSVYRHPSQPYEEAELPQPTIHLGDQYCYDPSGAIYSTRGPTSEVRHQNNLPYRPAARLLTRGASAPLSDDIAHQARSPHEYTTPLAPTTRRPLDDWPSQHPLSNPSRWKERLGIITYIQAEIHPITELFQGNVPGPMSQCQQEEHSLISHQHERLHTSQQKESVTTAASTTGQSASNCFNGSPNHGTGTRTSGISLMEMSVDRWLGLPEAAQTSMLRILEQQNQIRILELKLQLEAGSGTFGRSGASERIGTSSKSRRSRNDHGSRHRHRPTSNAITRNRSASPRVPIPSDTIKECLTESTLDEFSPLPEDSATSLQDPVGAGEARGTRRSSTQQRRLVPDFGLAEMQSPESHVPQSHLPSSSFSLPESRMSSVHTGKPSPEKSQNRTPTHQPRKLSISKMLGLKGAAPVTLEEIKEINAQNLELTTNTHLPATMKTAPSVPVSVSEGKAGPGGLEFTDEEQVKKTLLGLNPTWMGTPEQLLQAMQAHLAGMPVSFALPGSSGAAQLSAGPPAGHNQRAAMDGLAGQLPSKNHTKEVHDGFRNVCQVQTHNLEIEYSDETTGEKLTRQVAVVQIYQDPPITVMTEFFDRFECQQLLDLTAAHWDKVDRAILNSVPQVVHGIAKLPRGQSSLIDRLIRRAVAACQVASAEELEDVLILRYLTGEGTPEHLEPLSRRSTLLVYLNEPADGGETDFVHLGFQIRPQTGTAVLWHNVKQSRESTIEHLRFERDIREGRMLHASLPVVGETPKFVLAFYVKNLPPSLEHTASPSHFSTPSNDPPSNSVSAGDVPVSHVPSADNGPPVPAYSTS